MWGAIRSKAHSSTGQAWKHEKGRVLDCLENVRFTATRTRHASHLLLEGSLMLCLQLLILKLGTLFVGEFLRLLFND